MTTKEEDFLIQNFGKERHFTVPEGYFAQFNARIMEQVANDGVRSDDSQAKVVPMGRRSPWRSVVYAAACLLAAVVMTGAYLHAGEMVSGEPSVAKVASVQGGNDAIDQAADYMMLDKSDLYAYMSE